jgi:hypothetical protein
MTGRLPDLIARDGVGEIARAAWVRAKCPSERCLPLAGPMVSMAGDPDSSVDLAPGGLRPSWRSVGDEGLGGPGPEGR